MYSFFQFWICCKESHHIDLLGISTWISCLLELILEDELEDLQFTIYFILIEDGSSNFQLGGFIKEILFVAYVIFMEWNSISKM